MGMVCSRLLPEGLVSPLIPPTKGEQKQMTSQIVFCFHRVDCYESLIYSLLPSLKGIMLGWFQNSSLLAVIFKVNIKVDFQLQPLALEKYLAL